MHLGRDARAENALPALEPRKNKRGGFASERTSTRIETKGKKGNRPLRDLTQGISKCNRSTFVQVDDTKVGCRKEREG